MRTVFVAEDGKEFNNVDECMDYEWMLNHPAIDSVNFYDIKGRLIIPSSYFSDNLYMCTYKINVPNMNALNALNDLGEYCGFCSFKDDIKGIGTWMWSNETDMFEEVDE